MLHGLPRACYACTAGQLVAFAYLHHRPAHAVLDGLLTGAGAASRRQEGSTIDESRC